MESSQARSTSSLEDTMKPCEEYPLVEEAAHATVASSSHSVTSTTPENHVEEKTLKPCSHKQEEEEEVVGQGLEDGINGRGEEEAVVEETATTTTRPLQQEEEEEDGWCGREKLKRHRVEVAGRVWIPETWGQEKLLKDWIDCSAFDAALMSNGIMSARDALAAQQGLMRTRLRTPSPQGLSIGNSC